MSSPNPHMLLLMRHAKSDWANSNLSDKERPLNDRGRSAAPLMASWLFEQSLIPSKVLCSTANRTRQTLDLMLEYWKRECRDVRIPSLQFFDELYLASSDQILYIASKNAEGLAVLVLGHNPGIEELASKISGEEFHMPTGAISIFESALPEWPTDWSQPSQWNWQGIVNPREIGKGTI